MTEAKSEKKTSFSHGITPKLLANIFTVAALGAFVVIGLYIFNFRSTPFSAEVGDWGAFGDYIGGILNPLFGFLGLLALLLTIKLQSQELRLSRLEMEATRKELEGSKEAHDKQNFETSFFNMLKAHRDVTTQMTLSSIRSVNEWLFDSFEYAADRSTLSLSIKGCLEGSGIEISHYFKSLETLLKYIDRSDSQNKPFYSELVEAQLSNPELLMIFYYGLQTEMLTFKTLVERNNLLKNLNLVLLQNEFRHSEESEKVATKQNIERATDVYAKEAFTTPT